MIRLFQFFGLAAVFLCRQPAAAESSYVVDAWGTADGLPQSSVIALTQTRDGYLWLGTLNGLVRFDGNSFTPFNVNNTPGLPSNRIIFLFEDSRSNLWVGTDNAGLCQVHNGEVKQFDLPGAKITSAFEDQGVVWFYDNLTGGLYAWQEGRLESRAGKVTDEFALDTFNRVRHLVVPGKNGTQWKIEGGRLLKFKNNQMERDFGPGRWVPSMVPLQLRLPSGAVGMPRIDANIGAVVVDEDGNPVVGTRNAGVYWMDASGGWRHIFTGDNSFQDTVLSLCFDQEGNLWVGTDGGGIYRVKRSYFETPAGLGSGVVKSVTEDGLGGLWAALNAQGVAYSSDKRVSYYPIGQGSNAWTVLVDRRQWLWAGTSSEGLFRLADSVFLPVQEAPRIGKHINALFEDREGVVWVGADNILAAYTGQRWKYYAATEGLAHGAVRALAEDTGGNLWIGTEEGLFQMTGGKITSVAAPVTDISALLAGNDGVLWVGSAGHGLARLAQGRWTRYTAANGLPGDDVAYLIEDERDLWMGSYEGLVRMEKQALANFAAHPGNKIYCRTLLTTECSAGAQPSAIRTHDGRFLFPTIEGVVSMRPSDLKRNPTPPPVIIESVLVDGVPQKNNPLSSTWPEAVILQPDNEQLEIHFTALNFSAPKRVRFGAQFKYQLDGRDKSWTDVGGERVAHFSRLAPGTYRFRVTAGNEDGWNQTGAGITIVVEPPFWRKPWFIAMSLLSLTGVLGGIIYLVSTAKLRRQLRLARQKEIVEHERARIARDLHDQLGANLTQITLLGEMAESDKELPDEIEQHAQQICTTARETTRSLDEIVWAVNPSNDTLESLANYACKYAQDYFATAGLSYRSELPPGLPPVPILPEVRHNVFLAFKEAVNNVVKHARATEARVKLVVEDGRFVLSVADNGRGLGDVSGKQLRNGLKNMRRRLEDIHGSFAIGPGPEGGTVVRLTVPVKIKLE